MYLANSRGQELKKHLAGVARASELILKTVANDEFYKKYASHIIFGGLVHDLGKCSPDFQKYLLDVMKKKNNEEVSEEIRGKKGKFVGPYHNEISSLII
jgi:HD superfamily phosphohydrolase YqeK